MTENAAITEIVEQISLGYPEISFSLTIDGREVLKTSGHGNLLEAISEVYGIESAKKMISIEGENGFFKIIGFICEPSVSYANRYHQLSFINKRPVTIIKQMPHLMLLIRIIYHLTVIRLLFYLLK